jgi:hypothetical protein
MRGNMVELTMRIVIPAASEKLAGCGKIALRGRFLSLGTDLAGC